MLHVIDSNGWTANTAWCVPTAVSFLTGIPLIHSHSRAAFLQDIALTKVKGVYSSEASLLLSEQGYKTNPINLRDKYSEPPKLKRFLSDRSGYEKCMPMMIQVEDNKDFCHMVVAHYGYAADNWTMKPVKIEDFPHVSKHVTGAWLVTKK